MKKLLLLFSLALISLPIDAQSVDFEALFNEQVQQSCERGGLMTKSVLSHLSGTTETKTFKIACADDEGVLDLVDELQYAFKYNAWNPGQKTDYKFESTPSYASGTPKAEEEEDIPLKLQEVKYNDATGKISYVRSRIFDESWFFSLSVEIEVFFDDAGFYEKHILRTGSDSMVSQEYFSTELNGEWSTEPNP